ncbi:hypothetical protein [Acidocella aminolytica]|uniref:Uncharacterized protein n=1 Tax=Acidocella aminolytica 101 = DSM 11237 TaxID=1120923 RepID=A0A0D6PIB0_9PROT|nr:hypothetical protein [Acidocella aminolytica]GAN81515.1 hypothetical protein Aam_098_007 [Acidocella aminolytica 101 = DSM 11237]GBQ33082.1 hypothetical protein AA11237_0329 [Acidocella aminolytica 101 = DSM 11237]SHF56528.1 hypothetical protein SAMN02746095_03719 [Acidocella aminolytica 101 = DSM 11237]
MKAVQPSSVDDPNEALWRNLLHAARHDDGAAAKELLQAGFPIYYAEDDNPVDLLIKEHPSGRRELMRFDRARWLKRLCGGAVDREPGRRLTARRCTPTQAARR